MDPCILADTGVNQTILLAIGSILLCAAVGFLYLQKRFGIKSLVLLFAMFGLTLFAALPATSYAQTAGDCPPAAQDEDSGSSPQVLSLVNDQGVLQRPSGGDGGSPQTYLHLAILANDNALAGDPIDWTTIDLDPNTAGQQTSLSLTHPSDATYSCGSITVSSFGILEISLNIRCYNESFDELTIPGDYAIPPFTYTAQTLGGNPAPAPATVTILVVAEPEPGVVFAQDDQESAGGGCSFEGFTLNLVANDSTTTGTIDPTTVDLNPGLPGLQKTVTLDYQASVFQASVDNSGVVTVTRLSGIDADPPTFYYTVQNTNGDVSNVATILYECMVWS